MSELKFSKFTPSQYGVTPSNINTNSDIGIVLNNLCDNFEMSPLDKDGSMSETEHAAMLADTYFSTDRGRQDIYTLKDISNRLSISFTRAFELIQDHIHPRITNMLNKIDKVTDENVTKSLGYQNKDGEYTSSTPKLYLLDVADLYTRYNGTANDFVSHFCAKYNYNVEYLNDANVTVLLNRVDTTENISIPNDTLLAILQDVEIKIVSNADGDVVIDTNDPDAVKTENATKHDIIDDESSDSSSDTEEVDPLLDDDTEGDINANIDTGNDNANINVNINGEKITTEEKELLTQLVKASFNKGSFEALREKLFAPKGSVTYKNLESTLFIVKNPIANILEDVASDHLSELQMSMLRSNFKMMTELQMAGIIYLDVMAMSFSDKIIIGPNLLNKNLVNKALSEGINIYPIVRNYLRVYHNTNKDDLYYDFVSHDKIMNGVKYTDLLASSYTVQQKLVDIKELTKGKCSTLIATARASAYKKVMTSYIRKLSEDSTEQMLKVPDNSKQQFINDCDTFIDRTATLLENNPQTNVEDMLYELLLDRWYQGTIVADIYRNFQEHVRLSAEENTLDDNKLALIKARVIATVGSKFLFKNFI